MRILHVIDKLAVGGAERLFVSITKLLRDKDVEVDVLIFNTGGALEKELDKRIQVHNLNRKSKYNIATLYKANRICSEYDIVHTHLRYVHAYIKLGQWLFAGDYKLIVHEHAAITASTPSRYKGVLKPKYFIGVNIEQVDWAIDTVGMNRNRVFLLENTIVQDTVKIEQVAPTNKAILVANLRSVKNIEFAIKLCKSIDMGLDIYGNIIEQDYYDKLQALISDDSSINIKQGITDFTNLYPQYQLALHSSPAETGPLVLIEYLSAGLPFVAYNTGSAAAAIAKQLPQLFMDNFEVQKWSERIAQINADNTLPEKMREVYAASFDAEIYINKCLNIYKSIHS